MTENSLPELAKVLYEVFPKLQTFSAETALTEMEGFDSLTRINLILAIEQTYQIRLSTPEISKLRTIGHIEALITRKLRLPSRENEAAAQIEKTGLK